MFKRASVRYSATPKVETRYHAAGQIWDQRLGGLAAQARQWAAMAGVLAVLCLSLGAGLIWQSLRSHIVPYIVQVNARGEVKGIGAVLPVAPTDAQIAHTLERFIRNVRSIPIDPIVLRDDWLEAYSYVTARGATALNDYARAAEPFKHVGQASTSVEVVSVVRASKDSFQIRWVERKFQQNSPVSTEHWTGIFTLQIKMPVDELQLRKNPLGVYVDALSWTRELSDEHH